MRNVDGSAGFDAFVITAFLVSVRFGSWEFWYRFVVCCFDEVSGDGLRFLDFSRASLFCSFSVLSLSFCSYYFPLLST